MRLAVLTVVLSLVLAVPARGAEESHAAARAVTESLVTQAYTALSLQDAAPGIQGDALRAAISTAFALDIWERFLVGDRGLDDAALAEFRTLLPGFLAHLYAQNFGKGLAGLPQVGQPRALRRDVMVAAPIPRRDADPLPVEYRLRAFPGRGPLVIDVMVAGISFLVLKREEFGALLDDGGAPRLLAFMRANSI